MKINGTEDARFTAPCDKVANAIAEVMNLENCERTAAEKESAAIRFHIFGFAPAKNAFYKDDTKEQTVAKFDVSVRVSKSLEIFVKNNINAIRGFDIDGRMMNEIREKLMK